MKCNQEQLLYGYAELSPSERLLLDRHLAGCAACRKKLDVVMAIQSTIRSASASPPEIRNPEELTRSILTKVNVQSFRQNYSFIASLADHLYTRLTLGGVSLLLLITFVVEQTRTTEFTPASAALKTEQTDIKLDTRAFVKTIRSGSNKAETTVLSLSACARKENCDNALIHNFKRKQRS